MTELGLAIGRDPGLVWRIGHEPQPFDWTPERFADFGGRWDDAKREFRTTYTADSLLGCFLELLANFRPRVRVQALLNEVEDEDGTIGQYPEARPGDVGYSWLEGRLCGTASLDGVYCQVTRAHTLGFLTRALALNELHISPHMIDAALLKSAASRRITQGIARWLYDRTTHDLVAFRGDVAVMEPEGVDETPVLQVRFEEAPRYPDRHLFDGVEFASRYGDDIRAWAVFERVGNSDEWPHSARLSELGDVERVTPETPELLEAFGIFGLHWRER